MGFDFFVIVPHLPSHCGFSFIFGCGLFFLVSSSVFLFMIVQQLVVILVLSQEGVSTCPSTPPSFLFIYLFRLCWVSPLRAGFSLRWPPPLWSTSPSCTGLSRCGTRASATVAHGLQSVLRHLEPILIWFYISSQGDCYIKEYITEKKEYLQDCSMLLEVRILVSLVGGMVN